jgi:Meiotically up-regulated gene 113
MIYFVQCDNADAYIKIGWTSDDTPLTRLGSLQSACPYKLRLLGVVDGDCDAEYRLHFRFITARVRGEWFKPVPALLDYIAHLKPRF